MTAEKLLRPRYKTTADYPNNPLPIGLILTEVISDYFDNEIDGIKRTCCIRNIDNYPNLFKKLEWWEGRQIEDMPNYIMGNYYNGSIVRDSFHKVEKWEYSDEFLNHNRCPFYLYIVGTNNRINARNILPATGKEFNEYNKPTNQAQEAK